MNTPTPRTDEAWSLISGDTQLLQSMKNLSHELERELTAITEQRDKLAEALRMITTFDYTDLQCDNGHGARSVATEALQSLTQLSPDPR